MTQTCISKVNSSLGPWLTWWQTTLLKVWEHFVNTHDTDMDFKAKLQNKPKTDLVTNIIKGTWRYIHTTQTKNMRTLCCMHMTQSCILNSSIKQVISILWYLESQVVDFFSFHILSDIDPFTDLSNFQWHNLEPKGQRMLKSDVIWLKWCSQAEWVTMHSKQKILLDHP